MLQRNDDEELVSSIKAWENKPLLHHPLHHNTLLLTMIIQSLPPSARHPILFIPSRLLLVLEPTVGGVIGMGNVPTVMEVRGLEVSDRAVEVDKGGE